MRTIGATSNVCVRLSQLNAVLQPDALVYIWRRQADQLGLLGVASFANEETLKAAGNPPAIVEPIEIREPIEQ